MWKYLKRILIGKPLRSTDGDAHTLNKLSALAMLSSDALSSVAYGTEQIVLVLMVLSSAAIWWSIPIAFGVLILLIALTLSYRQVIHAYPQGGGAYVVSNRNLGKSFGLIAGGSLLVDYMLTVAVSVSAGADAITSAVPILLNYQLLISILIVFVIMIMNLRGLRESANFLVFPVYLFVAVIILLIIVGIAKILLGIAPDKATASIGEKIPGLSIALLLRAFSSGSASLTGVEAISNAVPYFKKPKAKNAATTLVMMSTVLACFFGGITFLNYWYGIIPKERITVLAQVAAETFGGHHFLFYLFQFSTALILALAANTGFSAFPMLSFNLAKDKFMPRMYMDKGTRLGFSNGIITLAVGAIILLIIFQGLTERLIPLYSIGVFIPFALSQTGMVLKWKSESGKRWFFKSLANIVGALISFSIIIILFVFRLGDIWPFFVIMPVLLFIFNKIHEHYISVADQLRLQDTVKEHEFVGNLVIVLVGNVTKVNVGAINYARSIGDKVIAMHVSFDEKDNEKIKNEFEKQFPDVRLSIVRSSFRSVITPTVRYVDMLSARAKKDNFTITVLVPQFVPNRRWQQFLHNQTSLRIRFFLSMFENIIVANYNYHLKK